MATDQIEEEVVEEEVVDRGDELPPEEDDEVAAEPEAEEEPEEEEAEEEPEPEKPGMIPKGRFDDVLNERNWLREQLAKLGGKSTQPEEIAADTEQPAYDFAAKRREQMTAWEEGDDAKYLAIEREIMAATEEIIATRASEIAGQAITQREFQIQYDTAVKVQNDIMARRPELNEDGNEFYAFLGHRNRALEQGYSIDQALKIAELSVFGEDRPEATESAAPPARKMAAIRRNAAAAAAQPPAMDGGVGQRNAGVRKIAQMTDAEFDALPAAEKKRLRGD